VVSKVLLQEAVIRGYEAAVYCLAACLLQITWIVFGVTGKLLLKGCASASVLRVAGLNREYQTK